MIYQPRVSVRAWSAEYSRRALLVMAFMLLSACATAVGDVPRGPATLTLVDGTEVRAEVLFEHPNVPRLVIRSPEHRSVQSLDLKLIHQLKPASGAATTLNPKRSLTDDEKTALDRDGLWVDQAGKGQIGRYAKESWDARPVIVWRYPGKDGNAMEPSQWLDEKGEPLTQLPWAVERPVDKHGRQQPEQGRFDGDVLLPAADENYKVIQPGNRDHLGAFAIRHLTVERNGSYQVRYTIEGNLWMKDGAEIGKGTQTGGLGSGKRNKHTVARFCNWHAEALKSAKDLKSPVAAEHAWAHAPEISHWVWIDTGEQGSLEIVGLSGGAGDRLTLQKGNLVVSENSFIGNGNRGSFYTQEGTTAVLLDGARVGCPTPLTGGSGGKTMGTYGIAGTLLFGTPDHPLTGDLHFGACYYARDRVTPQASASQRTQGASFVLAPTGSMIVHSKDPKTARVIFGPRDKSLPVSQYVLPREHWDRLRNDRFSLWTEKLVPTGVAAVFRGQTDFNGVVFDGFYEGGIIVAPGARAKWRNVSFGDENHADPDKLFQELPQ
jgi:hypothetical protein